MNESTFTYAILLGLHTLWDGLYWYGSHIKGKMTLVSRKGCTNLPQIAELLRKSWDLDLVFLEPSTHWALSWKSPRCRMREASRDKTFHQRVISGRPRAASPGWATEQMRAVFRSRMCLRCREHREVISNQGLEGFMKNRGNHNQLQHFGWLSGDRGGEGSMVTTETWEHLILQSLRSCRKRNGRLVGLWALRHDVRKRGKRKRGKRKEVPEERLFLKGPVAWEWPASWSVHGCTGLKALKHQGETREGSLRELPLSPLKH